MEDDGGGGRAEHVEDSAHVVAFLLRALFAHFSDELQSDDLNDVAEGVELRDIGENKRDGARWRACNEHV